MVVGGGEVRLCVLHRLRSRRVVVVELPLNADPYRECGTSRDVSFLPHQYHRDPPSSSFLVLRPSIPSLHTPNISSLAHRPVPRLHHPIPTAPPAPPPPRLLQDTRRTSWSGRSTVTPRQGHRRGRGRSSPVSPPLTSATCLLTHAAPTAKTPGCPATRSTPHATVAPNCVWRRGRGKTCSRAARSSGASRRIRYVVGRGARFGSG